GLGEEGGGAGAVGDLDEGGRAVLAHRPLAGDGPGRIGGGHDGVGIGDLGPGGVLGRLDLGQGGVVGRPAGGGGLLRRVEGPAEDVDGRARGGRGGQGIVGGGDVGRGVGGDRGVR